MKIVLIKNKSELLTHRDAIDSLFFKSFGQRSMGAAWNWAYIDNPNGEPVVSLGYEGDVLVGHYAIVPMPLLRGTDHLNSYLSITSMVAESHRSHGLFKILGQETYRVAQDIGVDFVMGFPNKQAIPGRKKRLNWILPELDFVAKIDKKTLTTLVAEGHFDKTNKYSLDLLNGQTKEWRLGRPGGN
jgi:hypothetical protein